jgi:hypothetical protein
MLSRKRLLTGAGAILLVVLFVVMCRLTQRDLLFRESKFAIDKGDVVQLQKLLQQGAPPDGVDGAFFQGTPLSWAADRGDTEMMRLLIRNGADVNKRLDDGTTALMWATGPEAVQFLLKRGANPLQRSEHGFTAWDMMKGQKDEESAAILKMAAQGWRATHKSTTPKNSD